MCGIVGVIGKKENIPVGQYLKILRKATAHRGPDDFGEHLGDNFGFANLRLSIVDVAGGKQPIYNDDKSIGIVYNGEVYNFNELRADLEGKGYEFKTKTDTEVVLRAYEEYGVESFNKFNGMFGFCIWDDNKKKQYIVRDQIGIKPLYLYEDERQFIFSSEIKGILSIPNINLNFDQIGFEDYLTFRYSQAPYTLFQNIKKVEAGTYIVMEKGIATHFRYWDVDYDDKFPVCNIEEIKKELLAKLEKSVKSQLMGEVPVGVLLSGGLDSSAIAYFVKKCGANIKTFNIGFKNLNEFEYSSQVAKELGLEHMEILMSIDDVVSDFDRVMHALDEPIADPACIPLYMLGKELKKHVTVVLSGEGGDELFGGYNQYKYCLENDKKIPYQKFFEYFLEKSYYFKNTDHFLKNNNTRPISYRFKKYFEDQPLLNGMLAYDIKTWMPENLMMKADKILMAHSLEGRFPFLDMDLFQFSAKDVSQKYKISKNLETKWILKEAMEGLLPKDVIRRKKMGFSVPVSEILDKMKEKVSNTFKDAKMHPDLIRILNIDNIEKFSEEYYDGKKEHALQLWTFFVLIYWLVKVFPGYRQV